MEEDADIFSLIYARLASHVRPDFDAALILTAQILELQGQFDTATRVYAEVPDASYNHLAAEIGRANALRSDGKADAGIEVLMSLAKTYPDSMEIQIALGDAQSGQKNYAEAEIAYSSAIAMIPEVGKAYWGLYYSRAITLERQDKWDAAEKDFRTALELYPDQPLVLNYLGYSLVEKGRDLDEAQGMIEKAVKQRPDDGYITDSLGWVLYRLGKFREAVGPMERAVELLPVDPVLNDHLGDVLWKVDRKREAEFQWKRALSFGPDDEVAARIRSKLDIGLDAVLEQEAADKAATTANGG
jgi:Flp pilus assembly protein TadD